MDAKNLYMHREVAHWPVSLFGVLQGLAVFVSWCIQGFVDLDMG